MTGLLRRRGPGHGRVVFLVAITLLLALGGVVAASPVPTGGQVVAGTHASTTLATAAAKILPQYSSTGPLSLSIRVSPSTICAYGSSGCSAGSGVARVQMSAAVPGVASWPNVQVAFVLDTTGYAGFFGPNSVQSQGSACAPKVCEESNGIPVLIHNASQVAASIQSAHPGINVTFAMIDYFASGDKFDDGDGSRFHVDVANFTSNSTQFGRDAVANFTSEAPGYVIPDSDLADNTLHASSITALYGAMVTGALNWSSNAHHVIVWAGVTAPMDPGYVQNYSVATPWGGGSISGSALSGACEPAYNFTSGASPSCVGWVNRSSIANVSIAKFANQSTNCLGSLGGSCTIDTIDLWATPTDPLSRDWPITVAGGGPNGSVVIQNTHRVLYAGCDLASATNGTWDGPSFFACPNGPNGTLERVTRNSSFDNPKLLDSIRRIGFGLTPRMPGVPGRPMFTFVPFGNVSLSSTLNATAACITPSGPFPNCQSVPIVLHSRGITFLGWNWSTTLSRNWLAPGDRWAASFDVRVLGGPYVTVPLAACLTPDCVAAEGGAGSGPASESAVLGDGSLSTTESFPLALIAVVGPSPMVTSFQSTPTTPVWGETVQFSSTVTGGFAPTVYAWSFGDGGTSSLGMAYHSFGAPGTYRVVLNVTDVSGLRANFSRSISVTSSQLILHFASNVSVTSVGQPIALSGSVSGGFPAYHYRWSGLPSGCYGGDFTQLDCSPQVAGTYVVNLSVLDGAGNRQAAQFTILVNTNPVATIKFDAARGCGGGPASPVTFWVVITGGTPGYNTTWNFGDRHTAIGNRTVHTFGGPGDYVVTSQVTDRAGAVANSSIVMHLVKAAHCNVPVSQASGWGVTTLEIVAIGILVAVVIVEIAIIAYRRSR